METSGCRVRIVNMNCVRVGLHEIVMGKWPVKRAIKVRAHPGGILSTSLPFIKSS